MGLRHFPQVTGAARTETSRDARGGLRAFPVGWLELGPQLPHGFFKPNIGALLFDQVGRFANDSGIENRLALPVIERRDRHAPGPLARDAPVRPAFDGGFHAAGAPVGNPLHPTHRGEYLLAEGRSTRFSVLGEW